ncbi:MAG: right-handed parallel beta-helix repeat-containing protein [Thermoguttaceae bacterium]
MCRTSALSVASVLLAVTGVCCSSQASAEEPAAVVTVAQEGKADFCGTDERPILEAIQKLGHSGGTVVIGPGDYTIRQGIKLGSGVTIRGTGRTVLRLPGPVLVTADAPQGQDFLVLSGTANFRPDTTIQVCPPSDSRNANDEKNSLNVTIKAVEPGKVLLTQPLPRAVPQQSRVGYGHNLFNIRNAEKYFRLESLILDGGRNDRIAMPGHVQRCAILAHGNYSYQGGPGPSLIENLQVVACQIRNCYGRAVAMYAVGRSRVEGCLIEHIADEAIDFDHFCVYCEATGNEVRDSVTGVTINDGSYCRVQYNHLHRCDVGVIIWWWHMCPQTDIDVENVIAHNFVYAPKTAAISVGKRCYRNRVSGNFVEGPIKLDQKDNVADNNMTLE